MRRYVARGLSVQGIMMTMMMIIIMKEERGIRV